MVYTVTAPRVEVLVKWWVALGPQWWDQQETLVTPKYLLIKVRQHSSSELKVNQPRYIPGPLLYNVWHQAGSGHSSRKGKSGIKGPHFCWQVGKLNEQQLPKRLKYHLVLIIHMFLTRFVAFYQRLAVSFLHLCFYFICKLTVYEGNIACQSLHWETLIIFPIFCVFELCVWHL